MDNQQLLHDFVERQSEPAFAELVARHVNLVYATALRLVGEPHMARDVAQSVFIHLARKARSVREGNALPGWLYRAACRTASNAVRTEKRRREREKEAVNRAELDANPEAAWDAVAPLLDDAVQQLNRTDQDAIVLRFFENKSLREIGTTLSLTEDAVQKRVSRALDKLRGYLGQRGVKLSSGVLAALLAGHAAQAAPAGLAATLAGASLATGTAAGVGGLLSTLGRLLANHSTAVFLTLLVTGAVVVSLMFKNRRAPETVPNGTPQNPPQLAISPTPSEARPASSILAPSAPEPAPRLMARVSGLMVRVSELSPLNAGQIESYLEQNKRTAQSLLAAYRVSTNLAYLTEAASRFPADPGVQYAVIATQSFPEIQRQWIEAYKASSPDNALAWYFSAHHHFKSGENAQAIQELVRATQAPAFRAELAPMLQAVEELNLSAGRAADEAGLASFYACVNAPHMEAMRELARSMNDVVEQYRQGGDSSSVESLSGMGLTLGEHLRVGGSSQLLIYQLAGIGIEKLFLRQLDPVNGRDLSGRPVAEITAEIDQHQTKLKNLIKVVMSMLAFLDDAELADYVERVKLQGEEAAMTWIMARQEPQ